MTAPTIPAPATIPFEPPPRPASPPPVGAEDGRADRAFGVAIVLLGAGLVAAGLLTGEVVWPFPWGAAGLVVVFCLASRRFGISLPGKGFTSFVAGFAAAGVVALGWGAGALLAALAVLLGDLVLRRRAPFSALVNGGHTAVACCAGGLVYALAGGDFGVDLAARRANAAPLVLVLLLVPVVLNSTFYWQMELSHARRWVDRSLTLRWEVAVTGLSIVLAVSGLLFLRTSFPPTLAVALTAAWLAGAALAHWLVRQGINGESLLLVQRLSRALGARAELAGAFHDIQELTSALLPWHDMGLAAYDDADECFVVLLETSASYAPGTRLPSGQGLTALALERMAPVTCSDLPQRERERDRTGSEILVPLRRGERLVGLWSVRHRSAGIYDAADAQLLGHLGPQLALSLSLHRLVGPVLDGSEDTARHVDAITDAARALSVRAEDANAASRRLASSVATLARTLARGAEEAEQARTVAEENAGWGEETRRSGLAMVDAARGIRDATGSAVARLEAAAAVVQQGADEVARLQEVSGTVEHFRRTINELAHQSSLLALNATIEAVRAGSHGRGFEVVAHEMRALADRSASEAHGVQESVQYIREALERAIGLMLRTRGEVLEVTGASGEMTASLDRIVEAAEAVARTGEQIAGSAQETARRSRTLAASLAGSQAEAEKAASATASVAASSDEQHAAIDALTLAAVEVSATAGRLAEAAAAARTGR